MNLVSWVPVVLLSYLSACALQSAPEPRLGSDVVSEVYGSACAARIGPVNHIAQKVQVDAALKELMQRQKTDTARLEQDAARSPTAGEDARFDNLTDSYNEAREVILQRLAAQGNADAMYRLSDAHVRESDAPADVNRWFALISCSAELGHPGALGELVRWYWHQRGDGSIRQVQANRARAFTFANRAAMAGNMFGVSRIATYISGDLHQYPGNLKLGQHLLLLCAKTGDRLCEESVAGEWGYDPGLSAMDAYEWVSRAAGSEPERFAKRQEIASGKLTPAERERARRAVATWHSTPWADLQDDWKAIEEEVLAYGETSTGALPACDTARPWCRTVTNRLSTATEGRRRAD
jgi:hypothetical protein